MVTLPREIIRVLRLFEESFSGRVWERVQVLVVGAILTPGVRTVAAILRVLGLSEERQFQNYHRVLNRARWSSRKVSRRLVWALVRVFGGADAPIVVGMDDTIERRWGPKIAARGIYRDPVRSSKGHPSFVRAGFRQGEWAALDLVPSVGSGAVGRAGPSLRSRTGSGGCHA